jgi:DNA-binding CsgD family transcriptional regulator
MMKATETGIASLNDIHKDCLRLAIYHYSSKEIGLKLGISRHTVDQRLRHATQRLGASTRFEAARMLADHEAETRPSSTPHPFVYKPPYISKALAPDIDSASVGVKDGRADGMTAKLNDAQAPYVFSRMLEEAQPSAPPVSFMGVSTPDLSLSVKAIWAAGIATASLFAFVATIAGLEVLSRIQ